MSILDRFKKKKKENTIYIEGKERILIGMDAKELKKQQNIIKKRIDNVKTEEDLRKLDEDHGPIPENVRKMLEARVKTNKSNINEWD